MSVSLVDHMGSDESVARAAWVSTGSDERDASPAAVERLIRFLLENRPTHASPFGHPHVTLLVETPIFVAREWMRHRTQSFSEISSRYTDLSGEAYLPPIEDFRFQVGKPGAYTFEAMDEAQAGPLRDEMAAAYWEAQGHYQFLLSRGLAREVARNVLPLGTTTRFYATASLRNWLDFLVLRAHPAALLEIRREAEVVESILAELFPVTVAVWDECGRPQL